MRRTRLVQEELYPDACEVEEFIALTLSSKAALKVGEWFASQVVSEIGAEEFETLEDLYETCSFD